MQKTTYYENSSTLFGGYSSYQVQGAAAAAANGFGGFDAPVPVSHHQPAFQSATHLDVDSYQRSACSLQSLGSTAGHQQQQQLAKTKELNGSCMRSSLPPEHHPSSQVSPPLPPNPSNGNTGAQQPGGSAGTSSKSGSNKSSTSSSSISSSTSSSSSSLPPNPTLAKQIFPWMKECRQTTKQKTCSPSNNSGNGVFHYTCLFLLIHTSHKCSSLPHLSLASSLFLPPFPIFISVFVPIISPSRSYRHITFFFPRQSYHRLLSRRAPPEASEVFSDYYAKPSLHETAGARSKKNRLSS